MTQEEINNKIKTFEVGDRVMNKEKWARVSLLANSVGTVIDINSLFFVVKYDNHEGYEHGVSHYRFHIEWIDKI